MKFDHECCQINVTARGFCIFDNVTVFISRETLSLVCLYIRLAPLYKLRRGYVFVFYPIYAIIINRVF